MKDANCPKCNALINGATNSNERDKNKKPKKGDLSVCGYCAQILIFNDELFPIEFTNEQFNALSDENKQNLMKAVGFVKALSPN